MSQDSENRVIVSDTLRRYAAILGASGVAAGAFGAHALKETLTKRGSMENWRTAVAYQLFHATTLLGISALAASGRGGNNEYKDKSAPPTSLGTAGNLMALGTVLFSGSIYCLCLGVGPKRLLGPTTPIGGLFMIAGWVMIGM